MGDTEDLALVKRFFGGEFTEPQERPSGNPKLSADKLDKICSAEARVRWKELNLTDRKKVMVRAERLISEMYPPAAASDLALGVLPKDLKYWPPKQRYQLAGGMTREDINRELYDWFWRNHERKN